jgi:VanZ family protein
MRFKPTVFAVFFWLALGISSYLMLMEITPKAPLFPYVDKAEHVITFLFLTIFGIKAYPSKTFWILVMLAAYGISIELMQGAFTLTREASVLDWLADVMGIALAYPASKRL